ncbi:MAG: TldD/PmbA family protein [Spirulina sp. SIO3F2]|nr:TldD/PmbA family protein [Spirulina sp. SIO3F2]
MFALLHSALEHTFITADWIGLRAVREVSERRSVRDGYPLNNGRTTDQGVMVEVLVKGQMGYAATHRCTETSLQHAIKQAYDQAIAAQAWSIHPFSPHIRPTVVGEYVSACTKPLDLLSPAEINEILVRLCQELKAGDKIVQTFASVTSTNIESWLVSSGGSRVYQQVLQVMSNFGATAQDGNIVQPRTSGGFLAHSYQGGWERFLTDDLWARSRQVGEQALELLSAPDCPTETTTLVLAPDQMMLQIHESIGHPLELDRILGDERNYAGGSFVKPEDFGQLMYGSSLLNVTFDPTVPEELASYAFDDTGAIAEKTYLIKNGKLERGLGSNESQARLGVNGVACARASAWNRPPIDRMANLNIEPGDRTFEELIAEIESGVYMESNRSWSIDDQRHKFQFGCEYARRIENGQLTTVLRNPNYRAITPEFWQSLVQVGDHSTWRVHGTPNCGKGEPNQVIRVGHAAPVCVFDQIEVFGGAA